MTPSILVAQFETHGDAPSARELALAAVARGAAFVAVDVEDGDRQTPDAHLGGERVASLERLAREAARAGVGLFLRLPDTLSIAGLAEALGVPKGASSAAVRDQVLVVVDADRTGKRLRHAAPQFPSAYEAPAKGARGLLRFASFNYQRAVADCDDLVLRWSRKDIARVAPRVAADLARRGARLWISDVPEADVARAAALTTAGIVVRCALTGPPLVR